MARKFSILMAITFWVLMTGLFVKKHYFVQRGISQASKPVVFDPEYRMGVFYGGERIGEFSYNAYPWADDSNKGYRAVSSLHLEYSPVGEAHITGESYMDTKLSLQRFKYRLRYKLEMFDEQDARLEGEVRDGRLSLTVKWGTFEKTLELPAKEGISLYDPITPWIVGGELRPGREYTVEVFNRFTRRPERAVVKVLREKQISFDGKKIPGFEVETTVGDLKSTFRIGRDGKVYRMESPVGFSLVREPMNYMEKQSL